MSASSANALPGSRQRKNPCGSVDFRMPQHPLVVGDGVPHFPPASLCGAGGQIIFRRGNAPVRVGDVDAIGSHSDYRERICPPVKQVAAGEAKPGEVRAFDLPLVRPQAKGALPSTGQWIQGFQTITPSNYRYICEHVRC